MATVVGGSLKFPLCSRAHPLADGINALDTELRSFRNFSKYALTLASRRIDLNFVEMSNGNVEGKMKRLHVHVFVEDLSHSVRFYSTLFASEPSVLKDDYAKWMLDDPRVNFAISKRAGNATGISHLGIQAETETELAEVYDRLSRAERPIVEAKATTCCYAKSDKQWIADPQGVAWETFLTYGEATVYGTGSRHKLREISGRNTCCEPEGIRQPMSL